MRSYGTIPSHFWLDDMGANIRGNAAALTMCCYLMSSPHSNMIGIYRLPIEYIKIDTGLAEETIRETLAILRGAQWAFYDEEAKTVWIPSYAATQVARELKPKDKRIPYIQKEVRQTTHEQFKKLFLERYAEAFHLSPIEGPPEGDGSPIEGASEGHGRGIEGPLPASDQTKTAEETKDAVDNQGASKGHRRGFDTVVDTVPDKEVKRGLGREEERRPPVRKIDSYLEEWPRQMASKQRA